MRGPGQRWSAFLAWLDEREAPQSQAAFRVAVGLVTLLAIQGIAASGMHRVVWLGPEHGGYDVPQAGWLVRLLGGPTPRVVEGLIGAASVGGVLLALGLLTRPAALVTTLCCEALFDLDRSSGGGHDSLLTNALWLVTLGSGGAAWSLDARRWPRASVPAWPRRLAVVQLMLVYLTAGIHKLGVEWMPWGGFTALHYTLQTPHLLRRPPPSWLAAALPLTQAATAATMLFEVGGPLWVLAHALQKTKRDPRPWLIGVGVALHVGIWITMDLGPFSAIALAFYPCLHAPDGWLALARQGRRG